MRTTLTSTVVQLEQTNAENTEARETLTLFTNHYDLLLIGLPKLNSLEVAKSIRALENSVHLPIIVLTTHDFSIKTDCLGLGVLTGHLLHPRYLAENINRLVKSLTT